MPDRRLIKQSLAFRAKYRTKREGLAGGVRNLYAWQIVPHPQACSGVPIRSSRTKALAGDILAAGYDPTEGTVDSVVVEVGADAGGGPRTTFADHFKANVGLDPDHYINPAAVVLFAGLSHNCNKLAERNVYHGMPGCNCDPPAISLECCTCHAKPILEQHGQSLRYSMNKSKGGRSRLAHCHRGRLRVGDPEQ